MNDLFVYDSGFQEVDDSGYVFRRVEIKTPTGIKFFRFKINRGEATLEEADGRNIEKESDKIVLGNQHDQRGQVYYEWSGSQGFREEEKNTEEG